MNPELVDSGATHVAIIGGGATGVEVAGYLTEVLFRYSFPHDYPMLPRDRIAEASDRIGPSGTPD